jgi:hypothetical protein
MAALIVSAVTPSCTILGQQLLSTTGGAGNEDEYAAADIISSSSSKNGGGLLAAIVRTIQEATATIVATGSSGTNDSTNNVENDEPITAAADSRLDIHESASADVAGEVSDGGNNDRSSADMSKLSDITSSQPPGAYHPALVALNAPDDYHDAVSEPHTGDGDSSAATVDITTAEDPLLLPGTAAQTSQSVVEPKATRRTVSVVEDQQPSGYTDSGAHVYVNGTCWHLAATTSLRQSASSTVCLCVHVCLDHASALVFGRCILMPVEFDSSPSAKCSL